MSSSMGSKPDEYPNNSAILFILINGLCIKQKKQKQMEIGGDLYNKDSDDQRKLPTGFQMSKDDDGLEANFQIAFWKRTRKKNGKVTQPIIEEPDEW